MADDFHALIRLHQHRVDEKRRALAVLLHNVARLEKEASELERRIVAEQKVAAETPEGAGQYYGNFARAAVQRRGLFAAAIADVEKQIAAAQEQVREEFRDFKSISLAQESRDDAETAERARLDQYVLDELGLESHRRKMRTT